MDKHTPEQRRRNMKAVKNKDSQIEVILRRALFSKGYRYRKNYSKVFGCPDIVFVKEKIAIFCDSEFWHGYDWENRKSDFKSKQDFWIPKIERNMERDREVTEQLEVEGYVVLRFWGKRIKSELSEMVDEVERVIAIRRKRATIFVQE
ncbi:MAG: very short patch repair endonuclease [Lachnospiraceae bacterium]|jgi:DNA mismatch endonuclease Vsr|nr:very short patch repair endonuclease [Lachnospiraceae bacterium]